MSCLLSREKNKKRKKKNYKKRNNNEWKKIYRSGKQEVLSCEICCLLKNRKNLNALRNKLLLSVDWFMVIYGISIKMWFVCAR